MDNARFEAFFWSPIQSDQHRQRPRPRCSRHLNTQGQHDPFVPPAMHEMLMAGLVKWRRGLEFLNRGSGGSSRTVDALWNLCGRILNQLSDEECRNYFKHCGYRYD
jgi:hypothetical protein